MQITNTKQYLQSADRLTFDEIPAKTIKRQHQHLYHLFHPKNNHKMHSEYFPLFDLIFVGIFTINI